MQGWGKSFVKYSLDQLEKQTFEDFEVVITDHSQDDGIMNVANLFKDKLDIKYIRNENKRGSSSANFNNGIDHAAGDIIKFLCQDDYLYQETSLEKIVHGFEQENGWLVSAYLHAHNRGNPGNLHIPDPMNFSYSNNLIGTPSCLTILNDNPMKFDEELNWYLDADYYHRLVERYGQPVVIEEPTFVQFLWAGQMTNTIVTAELDQKEKAYLEEKYGNKTEEIVSS